MEEELTKAAIDLLEGIKSVAPEVWAIAVKQSYVGAFQSLIGFLFLAISSVVLGKWYLYLKNKDGQSDDEYILMIFFLMFALIFIPLSVVLLVQAGSYLLNPEYYAIELLMEIVR